MIDLTLDAFLHPNLIGLQPEFGTVITPDTQNKGGLSTAQVDNNMGLAFALMRPKLVSQTDVTSQVEYDAKLLITGDQSVTITLGDAVYEGCKVTVFNKSAYPCFITSSKIQSVSQGQIVIPSDNLLELSYTESRGWVYTSNADSFTYVVDSDQALLDWANNVSGNDYSAVLIRRGTWTSTVGVNLTASGTKVVVGEVGSKLVFNSVEKGLFYNTVPTTSDYWMRDVSVECTGNNGSSTSYSNCTNLISCTSTGTGTRYGYGYGYRYCTNLINCVGVGNGTIDGFGLGFSNCTNLISCTGTGTGPYQGHGFYNCTNLINCTGTGTGSDRGSGFDSCKRVSGCKKGSTCTTSVFYNSYASFSATSTYSCADTANGGFNDTTN